MTTINTKEDFLRALSENPEWREAVRAQILGDELLQLPVQFQAFVAHVAGFINHVTGFIEEQRNFNDEMRQFREEQRQTNIRFEKRMDTLGNDMSQLKGYYAHVYGLGSPEAFLMFMNRDLGENLTYIRALTDVELGRMAYRADRIPNNVFRSFVEADLVIEVEGESGIEYIAVEASFTADQRDSDRALRNAGLLTRFTGRPARAVVASVRNDYHVQELVDSGAIYWSQLPERYPDPE